MREIKFRGKRISDGDWFYGDLITEVDGDFNITNSYIHIRLSKVDFSEDSLTSKLCLHEVDPKTVGQYTGLKDKNGKEIYEGDEFQAGKSKGFVRYYADSFEIEWYHNPENWNEHLRHHVGHGEVTGGHVHDTHSEVSP